MPITKALVLAGPICFIALASCSSESGSDTTSPGGANAGTANATAGTAGTVGSAGTAAGGATAAAGNGAGGAATGGVAGNTAAAGNGAGGQAAVMAPACPAPAGTNDSGLNLTRPELSAREVGSLAADNVVRIEADPTTGDILYMNRDGTIWQMDLTSGNSNEVYNAGSTGTGGGDHRGLAFGPDGTLYVLSSVGEDNVSVTVRKGVPEGGGGRTWSTLVTSDPYPVGGTNFDHLFGGLVVSPDGQNLFISSGSRTDHGEVEAGSRELPLTSSIFRVPTSGSDLNLVNDVAALEAAGYLFADGVRNSFDMAFNANGDLFATENGPDADFSEELNWIREGHHYGFPWKLGLEDNPVLDPAYDPNGDQRLHGGFQAVDLGTYAYDATFPPAPAVMTDPILNTGPNASKYRLGAAGNVEDATQTGMPMGTFTGHRSPLGLTFDAQGLLCGDYYQAGLMLSFGAFLDVLQDAGEDLMLLQMEQVAGEYQLSATQLVTGFRAPIDSAMFENRLYVVEFGGGGRLYEITFPTPAP